jgi:hypothetical protein
VAQPGAGAAGEPAPRRRPSVANAGVRPRSTCWCSAAARPAGRGGQRARRARAPLLVERYGFLGGMGTAGGVTNFAGLYGRRGGEMQQLVRGVADELLARIDALGGLNAPQDGLQGRIRVRSYDIPAYKCAADALLPDAGVRLLFHAWAAGVVHAPPAPSAPSAPHGEAGRLDALVVETKSGRPAPCARASSSTPAATPTWRTPPACPSPGATVTATRCTRAPCSASATWTRRVRGRGGRFKAIDRLMDEASARYRFRAVAPSCGRSATRAEWRANVTQLANADGRAVDATDAAS